MKYLVIITTILLITSISSAQIVDGRDKVLHFTGGAVIGVMSYTFYRAHEIPPGRAYLYSILTAGVVGAIKESMDETFDHQDMLYNLQGGAVILPIVILDVEL